MKRTSLLLLVLLLATVQSLPLGAAGHRVRHAILVAVDGWGAYSVPKADIPNIRSLMEAGCYTLKERCVLPSSSAINWASMFMGVGTELHGYTHWDSRTPEIPSRVTTENGTAPTIFSLMKAQRPEDFTACLYEWEGIKHLIDTLSVSYHRQVPESAENPAAICEAAEQLIREKRPTLLAVCIDQLDHVGHADGHDTPQYYEKLKTIDGFVGRIVRAAKDAGIWDETVILLTADHGGTGKTHGGKSLEEMEIPFIIAGKGVKSGGEFEESVMQYDTAATLAHIFRLKQPQVWTGRPVLNVFK